MIVLRRTRAPRVSAPNPRRQRVILFLILWFGGFGYLNARARRRTSEARSASERELTAMRVGLRMATARTYAYNLRGVELCLASDLYSARWVTVGVKELGGPWSPSSRAVLVPPRSTLRIHLPEAIGDRVCLFAGELPTQSDVDQPFPKAKGLLQAQDLAWGEVFVADAQGRFTWAPESEWLIAVERDDPVTWRGERLGLDRLRELLSRADPATMDALIALAHRDDVDLLRVGVGEPLVGVLPPGRRKVLLRPWTTVQLTPEGPRPRPLRLQVLRAPRPPIPVGAPG